MDESGRSRSIRHPRIHRPDAGGRLPVYVHVPGPLENHAGCDEGVPVSVGQPILAAAAFQGASLRVRGVSALQQQDPFGWSSAEPPRKAAAAKIGCPTPESYLKSRKRLGALPVKGICLLAVV